MVRAFVAIDLPQEVKDELFAVQKLLPSAKLSLAKDFHITLKFLGELSPGKVDAVKDCLSKVKFKPFSAALLGIGVFPPEGNVCVVWAGIEPEAEAIELQKQIDGCLENDFQKEKDFKPHITLARVKAVADKWHFVQQLQQINVKSVAFNVVSFKLKRSVLSKESAAYDDIAVFQ